MIEPTHRPRKPSTLDDITYGFEKIFEEPREDIDDALIAQSLLLDRAFCRLLKESCTSQTSSSIHMSLALRCQQQFRQSLTTLKAMGKKI